MGEEPAPRRERRERQVAPSVVSRGSRAHAEAAQDQRADGHRAGEQRRRDHRSVGERQLEEATRRGDQQHRDIHAAERRAHRADERRAPRGAFGLQRHHEVETAGDQRRDGHRARLREREVEVVQREQVARDDPCAEHHAGGHREARDATHEVLRAPGPAARREREEERRDPDREARRERQMTRQQRIRLGAQCRSSESGTPRTRTSSR